MCGKLGHDDCGVKRMYAKQGSIVEIDMSLEYPSRKGCKKEIALVLWNGYGKQPLLSGPNRWEPYWGTYETISRILGTADMDGIVRFSWPKDEEGRWIEIDCT